MSYDEWKLADPTELPGTPAVGLADAEHEPDPERHVPRRGGSSWRTYEPTEEERGRINAAALKIEQTVDQARIEIAKGVVGAGNNALDDARRYASRIVAIINGAGS